jgi:hypothetical protein
LVEKLSDSLVSTILSLPQLEMEPTENSDLRQEFYLDGAIKMTTHASIYNQVAFMNDLN